MKLPFKGDFRLTQGFGGNKAAYQKYGLQGHNDMTYWSYFDFIGEIVAPLLGKADSGILKTLAILSLTNPMQIIKSALSPLRLKTHQPTVFLTGFPRLNLRLYNSQTFKSIFSLFQMKSKGVFNDFLGRIAPNFLINHSSQSIPFWGLPAKKLSLAELLRRYHALLLQTLEQYVVLGKANLFNLIGFEQKRHNIFRLYTTGGHNTI